MTQVLIVFADSDDGDGPDTWSDWARLFATDTASEPVSVTRMRYSVRPSSEAPSEEAPDTSDWPEVKRIRTWEILPMLDVPSLVHICNPYTRAGEIALLAAKLLNKRIVLSDFEPRSSNIGQSLGIVDLADCLVCRSEKEADSFSGHPRVEVLDSDARTNLFGLSGIYRDLIDAAAGSR